MDSPGLFDTTQSHEDIARHIEEAIWELSPGPNAVLFTFPIGARFTEEEYNTFQRLTLYFGKKFVDHMIVVFTHGDRLVENGDACNVSNYLRESPQPDLIKVVETVHGRWVVFNNKKKDQSQVQCLLDMIQSLSGPCYSADGQYLEHITERVQKAEIDELKRKKHVRNLQEQEIEAERLKMIETLRAGEMEVDSLRSEAATIEAEADLREFQSNEKIKEALRIKDSYVTRLIFAPFTFGLSMIGARKKRNEMLALGRAAEDDLIESKKLRMKSRALKAKAHELFVVWSELFMDEGLKLAFQLLDESLKQLNLFFELLSPKEAEIDLD